MDRLSKTARSAEMERHKVSRLDRQVRERYRDLFR